MQFVLGIDIGTTHCKTVALSADGQVLHSGTAGYETLQASPGHSEQDAALIFSKFIGLVQHSLQQLKSSGHSLKAVCFSAAMHGIMAVDEQGRPLSKLITWADTRSNDHALGLRQLPGATELYNRTGTPIHPMSPLCKLLWMRQHTPEIFSGAYKFISIKEFIFFRLFGKYLVDHSIASATGLFDIYLKQWNNDALQIAGISAAQLSEPVPVTHSETALKEEYLRLFDIHEPVPFIIGASDGCLANLGSGAIEKGTAALTIGTSGAVRVVVEKPVPDAQQRLFNYILSDDLYVSGGAVSNGGAALNWLAENILWGKQSTENNLDELLQLAQSVPPGAEGLIFLPYLSGERAPSWDAAARGAFIGLQISHRREHLLRAVLEGISFALCQVVLAVEETNGSINTVFASGGFIKSAPWVQMVCDVLNKKMIVSADADASALGAAILGLHYMGWLKQLGDAKQLIPQGKTFEPNASNNAVYRKYFSIYTDLYPKLKDDFHQLGQLK